MKNITLSRMEIQFLGMGMAELLKDMSTEAREALADKIAASKPGAVAFTRTELHFLGLGMGELLETGSTEAREALADKIALEWKSLR